MILNKTTEFKDKTKKLARYCKALSHPARIAILEKLAERETCICGELVEGLPLAQSTVSQHLKELKTAGIIQGRIDGLKSCYCLNPKAVNELISLFNSLSELLEKGISKPRSCK